MVATTCRWGTFSGLPLVVSADEISQFHEQRSMNQHSAILGVANRPQRFVGEAILQQWKVNGANYGITRLFTSLGPTHFASIYTYYSPACVCWLEFYAKTQRSQIRYARCCVVGIHPITRMCHTPDRHRYFRAKTPAPRKTWDIFSPFASSCQKQQAHPPRHNL